MELQTEIKYSSDSEELGTLVCVTISKRNSNNYKNGIASKADAVFFYAFLFIFA
jgi:hypothetical protein